VSTTPDQSLFDVAVIGMGYVGLPLATAFASAGLNVIGFDVNSHVVSQLQAAKSHVSDVSNDELTNVVGNSLHVTDDAADLAPAKAYIVCVPTPLDSAGEPDLAAVLSAAAVIRDSLSAGDLVVLESTTYPGTTDGVFRHILEGSGLRAGTDFHLAFSPERVDPGNVSFSITNTPKIVGGLSPSCSDAVAALYRQAIETVLIVSGPREAELAKLIENTYRHVNIALVNELAVLAHTLGIDIWDSIRAAATKPFGFQAFFPGPGVGGHCIPIDPQYLAHAARSVGFHFRFASLAQDVNSQMHGYVVHRVQNLLNAHSKPVNGSKVLLLGMSYKANISDMRESPSLEIAQLLLDLGANLTLHDPYVQSVSLQETPFPITTDLSGALEECDVAVLLQAHREYDARTLRVGQPLIFDCRGLLASQGYGPEQRVFTL